MSHQVIDMVFLKMIVWKLPLVFPRFLADSYSYTLSENHYYHWNVTGPMFNTLHLMFETQYTELSLAVDLIAERIRALGVYAPVRTYKFC